MNVVVAAVVSCDGVIAVVVLVCLGSRCCLLSGICWCCCDPNE